MTTSRSLRLVSRQSGHRRVDQIGVNRPWEAQQCSATLHGEIDQIMVAAERTTRTEDEAGGYGEHWRVGLHSTQPNYQDR